MNFEYDIKKIEAVLWDFYSVTKVKTVIYNSDFSVITAIPLKECSFCTAMLQNPHTHKLCRESDLNSLKQCQKKKELIIYHCHSGLIEAVAPIRMQDIIVGYIMLGQVLEENCDTENLIEYAAANIGESAHRFIKELDAKSDAYIHASARLMESCVCYFLMNKFIHQKSCDFLVNLCKYIVENPAADLSTTTLCEHFKINRNYLYKVSNTYLGMPIASYVRNKRLQYAETLIKEGYSVTDAAEKAGFYDYGYFGKIFKRYIGKTPREIRKEAISL